MQFSVKQVSDSKKWEAFVRHFSPNNFLQSWAFGQFNKADGDEMLPLGVFDGENQVAAALFIKIMAKRGNYYACAAGPLVQFKIQNSKFKISESNADAGGDEFDREYYAQIIQALVGYLKQQDKGMDFIRIRPTLVQSEDNQALFESLGFRPAPMHLHAERSWVLDLSPTEDDLLKNMRKNTRYYVNRAPKDGVSVRISQDLADVDILYDLQQETVSRQHFVAFSRQYFQELFKAFRPADQVAMFVADYQGKPLAAAMINYYGDMAVYHYAASSSENRKIPGAYAILWEAIKEAKRRGCKYFNFWGVVGEDEKNHPWHGLSQFKRGFGGQEVWYLHAQDYPLNWKYPLIRWFEAWRKKRRGL
ncbi:MAG TPA: peptidoglycan bridge formation glycyltransferase FemA/FemB family protein [Candidatus Wirthbacteria bacterium]|nr:peptidoglycan bridge formation glycyltransferase FemA/FemB family protein [Candidatus Wirthbacteria bacterium]